MILPSPQDYDLPHSRWREHQYETYQWLQENLYDGTRFSILESPTGAGKTGMVTPLSKDVPVLALVSTLGLGRQYEREYGYFFLPGRQEHACILPSQIEDLGTPTAYECPFSPMTDCPKSDLCPYLIARQRAMAARKTVVTYKYAALAQWTKERGGVLICDEAHGLAEEVLDLAKFQVTQSQARQFDLPPITAHFPVTVEDTMGERMMWRVIGYLVKCWKGTKHYQKDVEGQIAGYRFHQKLTKMLDYGVMKSNTWFLNVGPRASWMWRGENKEYLPALVLRPLQADKIAAPLWENKKMTVLMSATIGNPDPLASALGIGNYEWKTVPHVIPMEKRPVDVIFEDRMIKRNLDEKPGLFRAQALATAYWIEHKLPSEWRGIILTTSYDKIRRLRKWLEKSSIGDRLWEPPKRLDGTWASVTDRIDAFLDDKRDGIIAVDTLRGWGHGLDLKGDLGRFVVVAGVQFPNPIDPYDNARRGQSGGGKYLTWLAHCGTMQAAGRVSRGTMAGGEYIVNRAALADGSAVSATAMRHYSDWFKETLI